MTYTKTRYKTYRDYLDADHYSDGNYRLLSSGEVIQLPPEDIENAFIASELTEQLKRLIGNRRLVSTATEIQVNPVGDDRVNRRPDVTVLRPEHINLISKLGRNAVLIGMPPPLIVVEVVSKGGKRTPNYLRDYEWKRSQYEWWQIPEYWIVDRHRAQVVIHTLDGEGYYSARLYRGDSAIASAAFSTLSLSASDLLAGNII